MRRLFWLMLALIAAAIGALVIAAQAQTGDTVGTGGTVRDWASLLAVLISIGTVIYTWLTAGSSANAETLIAHEKRITAHGERLAKIENDIAHLPPKDDVAELRVTIAKLEGTIGKLDAHLNAISGTVHNMDTYLRKGGQ
jgi:hypothetical protein